MTTTPLYCEATSPLSPEGCFGPPNHGGLHWGWSSDQYDSERVYWDDEPVSPAFTQAEVGILLTCLQPVTAFFPELVKKLEGMK